MFGARAGGGRGARRGPRGRGAELLSAGTACGRAPVDADSCAWLGLGARRITVQARIQGPRARTCLTRSCGRHGCGVRMSREGSCGGKRCAGAPRGALARRLKAGFTQGSVLTGHPPTPTPHRRRRRFPGGGIEARQLQPSGPPVGRQGSLPRRPALVHLDCPARGLHPFPGPPHPQPPPTPWAPHLQAALAVLIAAPSVHLALVRHRQTVPAADGRLEVAAEQAGRQAGSRRGQGQGVSSAYNSQRADQPSRRLPQPAHSSRPAPLPRNAAAPQPPPRPPAHRRYMPGPRPHLHDADAFEPMHAPRLALKRAVAVAQRAAVVPAPGP
jgi:hypothetical protein